MLLQLMKRMISCISCLVKHIVVLLFGFGLQDILPRIEPTMR